MNKKDNSSSDFQKVVYTTLGGAIIFLMSPSYIPYCICFGGLMISAYGIIDTINKSDARSKFDLKAYIENKHE